MEKEMKIPKAKEKILQSATHLMGSGGYHGTGTNAIIESADVSKGSFFYHFPDKVSLTTYVLERYIEYSLFTPLERCLKKHAGNTKAALVAFVDHLARVYAQEKYEGGCLLGNMALEVAGYDERLRHVMRVGFERWQSVLATALKDDDIAMDKARFIALYIAAIQGVTMLVKVHKEAPKARNEFRAIHDLINLAFRTR